MASRNSYLVVCREYPRADAAASHRRLIALIGMITAGHRVDLICPESERHLERVADREQYRALGVRVRFGDWRGVKSRLLRRRYDAVIFEWWWAAPEHLAGVRRLQPWAAVVVDAVDVCFRREEAAVAVGLMEAGAVAARREQELATYRAADLVLVVSDEDEAALRACGVSTPTVLVPIPERVVLRSNRFRIPEVLFVGAFGLNPANVDGVLWFAEQAWPAIRAAVPAARLTLVGGSPPDAVRALTGLPGIEVTGRVPDVGPYLERAAVSVAPLRFGGGVKGKVTEAMAHGVPVVATGFGAQGLTATPGEHLLVADEPAAFAAAVSSLLRDPNWADQVGRAGQQLIADTCSYPVVERQLGRLTGPAARRRPADSLRWAARAAFEQTTHALLLRRLVRRVIGRLRQRMAA